MISTAGQFDHAPGNHAPGNGAPANGAPSRVAPSPKAPHTTSPPPPPVPTGAQPEIDPLELIATGTIRVQDIARQSGMSILALAARICTAENLEALARVARLHAMGREMMAQPLVTETIQTLATIAREQGEPMDANEARVLETRRKACVDLLRFGGGSTSASPAPRSPSSELDGVRPASEEQLLELLERLGQEHEQGEGGGVCPQIAQISQMGREENGRENELTAGREGRTRSFRAAGLASPDARSFVESQPDDMPGVSGGDGSGSTGNRTGGTPMPPGIPGRFTPPDAEATQVRTANMENQDPLDDAHPP